MNSAGLKLLQDFEGYAKALPDGSCEAYADPIGVITIGWGFTVGVKKGDRMTRAEAEERLAREVKHYENGVRAMCERIPNENELAAMTCLAYNIGLAGFARSTVLREHNAGHPLAAAEAFALWNKAGGKVLPGLTRRRKAEAMLYLTPSTVPAC